MKHVLLYILFIVFYLPTTAQSICGEDNYNHLATTQYSLTNIGIDCSYTSFNFLPTLQQWFFYHIIDTTKREEVMKYYSNSKHYDTPILGSSSDAHSITNRLGKDTTLDYTWWGNTISIPNNGNIPSNCFVPYEFDVYKPVAGNDSVYSGKTLHSFKFTNLIDSDSATTYAIDSLNTFDFSHDNLFIIGNRCGSHLLPTCGGYKLSFYIRPYSYVSYINTINKDSILYLEPYTKECLFSDKDFLFIDSLHLDYYKNPFNKLEELIINNVAFNDTSQWTRIEVDINVSDTVRFINMTSFFDFDRYFTSNPKGIAFKNKLDSIENSLTNELKMFFGKISVYYLFDSVSLVPLGYENLDLCLNDTSLCLSDSVVIDAYQADFIGYRWSTGDTTPSISISTPGTYTLYADYPCGTLCDDFIVYPSAPDSLLPYLDTISICPLQLPYALQADSLANYLWNTGDTSRQMIAQSSGLYTIESTFYCGVIRDSVYIKVKAKEEKDIIALTDTLICAKALPFALAIADTFQSYAWSNGATTAQNTFAQAGEYFVEVSDGCHTYQDTFRLQTEDLDTGVFVQQHFYCPQDFPINIDGFTFSEVKDTIFSQTQSNACGSRIDSILLFVLPNVLQEKPSINIIDSCKQLGYYLVNVLAKDSNFSYQWESGNPLQFTTKGGETQQLIVSNACITFKIDTFIAKCPEQIIFALPTAFSPNNDGVNDAFRLLYLNPEYELIDLSIFNRWGSQIFSTDQSKTAWEGKFQNKNCPIDEYVYQLKLRHKNTSAVEIFSGSVLLIF